jgi:hypothetical protein
MRWKDEMKTAKRNGQRQQGGNVSSPLFASRHVILFPVDSPYTSLPLFFCDSLRLYMYQLSALNIYFLLHFLEAIIHGKIGVLSMIN